MKIAVVGAGPAGLLSSYFLLRKGYNLKIFEEHSEIGIPSHCAGVISLFTFSFFRKLLCSSNFLQNVVKGIRIGFLNDNFSLRYVSSRPRAYIIDRVLLDKELSHLVASEGGQIYFNTRVNLIEGNRLKIGSNFFYFDKVIDARGFKGYPRVKDSLTACQYVIKSKDIESEVIEIWIDKHKSPDFFFWVCPLNESTARVGVAAKSNVRKVLEWFVKKRFSSYRVITSLHGVIIISGPVNPVFKNVIKIGDAAGQTKPLTGGGLRYIVSASILLSKYIENPRTYGEKWLSTWKADINFQKILRFLYTRLNDERLKLLAKLLYNLSTFSYLIERGDMDFYLYTIRKLFKR